MKTTAKKFAGLCAVSNLNGVISAIAVHQQKSLKMLNAAGRTTVSDADLDQIKTIVTDVLTVRASAILLDPEFGLHALQHRHGKGLFLGYEKTGYDNDVPAAYRKFLIIGRYGVSLKRVLTVSRCFSTSHPSKKKRLMTVNALGLSGSVMSARLSTSRTSSRVLDMTLQAKVNLA